MGELAFYLFGNTINQTQNRERCVFIHTLAVCEQAFQLRKAHAVAMTTSLRDHYERIVKRTMDSEAAWKVMHLNNILAKHAKEFHNCVNEESGQSESTQVKTEIQVIDSLYERGVIGDGEKRAAVDLGEICYVVFNPLSYKVSNLQGFGLGRGNKELNWPEWAVSAHRDIYLPWVKECQRRGINSMMVIEIIAFGMKVKEAARKYRMRDDRVTPMLIDGLRLYAKIGKQSRRAA